MSQLLNNTTGLQEILEAVNALPEAGSGGDDAANQFANEDAFVTRSISGVYVNDRVEKIGSYAFHHCHNLTSVSFPVCIDIGDHAFLYCSSLITVSFPVCTNIGGNAFANCSNLTEVSFPVCMSIGSYTFSFCSKLTSASFPVCTNIGTNAFYHCRTLSTLILGASTVCTLASSNAFTSTPYKGYSSYFSGTPYIYVPASLVDAYKSATNWTYFNSYFSSIENLGGNLITFTIDGTEYQAEEGMIWDEWVESEYNTDGYGRNSTFDGAVVGSNGYSVLQEAGLMDTIQANRKYYTFELG